MGFCSSQVLFCTILQEKILGGAKEGLAGYEVREVLTLFDIAFSHIDHQSAGRADNQRRAAEVHGHDWPALVLTR